jgi:hypothetical protein
VTVTTATHQPEGALVLNTALDTGLQANAPATGTYNVSATVDIQNNSMTTPTWVSVQLLANGQIVDTSLISFSPSDTSIQSAHVDDYLDLTAGELVQVQAMLLTGAAEFTGHSSIGIPPVAVTTDELNLVRFATPPTVTNPGSQSNAPGDVVALPITANDPAGPLSYTAMGLPLGLTISNSTGVISGTISSQAASSTPYSVTVTANDGFNTGSTSFTWAVSSPPVITGNPTNQTVTAGANVSFTASANGIPAPTVQWQVSSDGGQTFSNISGATSTTLTLNNVTTAKNGYQYRAVFSNSAGNATTNAATLTASPPQLHTPPLLALFDKWLQGVETVNGNDTETVIDSLFGSPLLVSTYDGLGDLTSVTLFGINVTSLFELQL